MNICESCSGEISPGARFCRQCGAQVTTEPTEPMLPQTQKYGHQVERRYAPQQEPEPPAWSYQGLPSSTSPFESSPPDGYGVPRPRSSSLKFWVSVGLLGCMLMGGVASSTFYASADRRARSQERVRAEVENELRKEGLNSDEARLMKETAIEMQREAERMAREIGVPVPPKAPPAPPSQGRPPNVAVGPKTVGIDPSNAGDLVYPKSKILDRTLGPNTVIRMISNDPLEKVRDYYEALLPTSNIVSKGYTVTFIVGDSAGKTIVSLSGGSPTTIQVVKSGK
jgi:hypothetical protein